MLFVLALASALLAGHGTAGAWTHGWLHELGIAIVMAVAVHLILDLAFARMALIRVDTFDQVLVDALASMKPVEPAHPERAYAPGG